MGLDMDDCEDKKAIKYAEIRRVYGLMGGRPVKFANPKEMENKFVEFLAECDSRQIDVVSKGEVVKMTSPAPKGLEKFCLFAGITKTTFYEYAKKPKFKWITDVIQGNVEVYYIDQLTDGKPGNKADFVLKNCYGWEDKSQTEFVGSGLKKVLVEFVGDAENGGDERGSGEDTRDICPAFEGKVED